MAIVCADLDSIDRMLAIGILDGCVYCDGDFADCIGVYFSYGIFEREVLVFGCSNQIN
jgi:hypothetical protein